MGAVHDFGSMIISIRNEGRTIGDLAGDIIGARVKFLFMLIIFFALWIVVAIFGVVIASVFSIFPESVVPVWFQLPIAVWLGYMVYTKKKSHMTYGIIATAMMYVTIAAGTYPGLDKDVNTIAQPNFLAVNATVDENHVYLLTKTMYENLPFLQAIHPATKAMAVESAMAGLPVPLHPGAQRYYEEMGLDVPEHLKSN